MASICVKLSKCTRVSRLSHKPALSRRLLPGLRAEAGEITGFRMVGYWQSFPVRRQREQIGRLMSHLVFFLDLN
jgi:hypothetical protein